MSAVWEHLDRFQAQLETQKALKFVRASPGAASPSSFTAMRLIEHMGAFVALALMILGPF